MIVLSGADLVLPDRIVSPGTIVIDGERIAEIGHELRSPGPDDVHVDLAGEHHMVVPGFIDVHVHGAHGIDCQDGPDAVAALAAVLPRHGVTAFCPTSVACPPPALRMFLASVRRARTTPAEGSARVLPAHLESNFLNPEYCGAQPRPWLRAPGGPDLSPGKTTAFTSGDLLAEMDRGRDDIAIVTIAPEIEGGLALVSRLRERGHLVSLGHSAATYQQALAAIAAGATQATHLFNRMPPLGHREPGLAGAALESGAVAVELVCDGHHVHPAVMRLVIAAKTPARVMAITDGTAGAGLPVGARAGLAGQAITVRETGAYLDAGTLAGSVLSMNDAFRVLTGPAGLGPVDASTLCSTTPARQLGLPGLGALQAGAIADLVVLDKACRVVQTWIGGRLAYRC